MKANLRDNFLSKIVKIHGISSKISENYSIEDPFNMNVKDLRYIISKLSSNELANVLL
jgi:hypothetical protein